MWRFAFIYLFIYLFIHLFIYSFICLYFFIEGDTISLYNYSGLLHDSESSIRLKDDPDLKLSSVAVGAWCLSLAGPTMAQLEVDCL